MSEMCYRCFRPKSNCLCPYIHEADTGVKFVILMHPKEAFHQRTGTGRLAQLALQESEIIIGIDFSGNERLNKLLGDPHYYPVMLYPGVDAYTSDSPLLRQQVGKGRRLLVVVVDATWFLAAKMVRLSRNLQLYQSSRSIEAIIRSSPSSTNRQSIVSLPSRVATIWSRNCRKGGSPSPAMWNR